MIPHKNRSFGKQCVCVASGLRVLDQHFQGTSCSVRTGETDRNGFPVLRQPEANTRRVFLGRSELATFDILFKIKNLLKDNSRGSNTGSSEPLSSIYLYTALFIRQESFSGEGDGQTACLTPGREALKS